jgi:hypothetical protein
MALGLLLAVPAVALADDFRNDIDNTFDASFETLALEQDGDADTVNIVLQTQGSDGDNGCNLDDSEKVEVQAVSSDTDVATVKWADTGTDKVEFLGCGSPNSRNLTVTPGSAGTANITLSITGATATPTSGVYTVASTGSGTYDVRTAQFTADVAAPPNTAPNVSVTGVEHGATYDKGSVPAAGCSVTDTEDGLNASTDAASPQVTSSNLDSDGLGTVTVECSYTDGGGLTEAASATYTIQDPSAPTVGYTLNPASADGNNGWYKGNVTLTWNVSEPQSPNSLVKTGCVDQTINADQAATTYSCSATSSGGSSGTPVSVTIKRDGTLPSVVTNGTATGTQGSNSWYTTAVSQPFRASDALSGLVGLTSPHNFTEDSGLQEGSNVSISSGAFSDNAGNSNTGTSAGPFKIDLTDPTTNVAVTPTQASTGWYNLATGAPTADFSCADADGDNDATNGGASGVATCPTDVTFGSSDSAQSAQGSATDNAGRSDATPASVSGIKVDLSKPTNVAFQGGPAAGSYDFGSVPAAPTGCTADDTFSGMPANGCVVTGYSTAVGNHTLTATATDTAGNQETATRSYSVLAANASGFYSPVDMGGILNTGVKAGSTIPVKFELFGGFTNTEQKTTNAVSSMTARQVSCGAFTGAPTDNIEYLAPTSENTGLRFDLTGDQFIYNWKTPKQVGCYSLTMTAADNTTKLVAYFQLK